MNGSSNCKFLGIGIGLEWSWRYCSAEIAEDYSYILVQVVMPSLLHLATVKIAVMLWNQDDIKTRITHYLALRRNYTKRDVLPDLSNAPRNWSEIEDLVLNKVNELMLPECLKEKLSGVIKPIGLELVNCYEYYCELFNDNYCVLPNNFCWTSLGQVDKKKTAAVLVKDETIYIEYRYILACNYCFEDDIQELWNSLPEMAQEEFYDADYNEADRLTSLWSCYLREALGKSNDEISDQIFWSLPPYIMGFTLALYKNNKPATEYFLKKLNPEERADLLVNYSCNPFYSDVLFFLISQMNENQQIIFLSKNTFCVLKCLLDWPFQSFFKKTFERICELDLLREEDFYAVLKTIMTKISKGLPFLDYNYHELLEQIWLLSPDICKKHVLRHWAERGSLLDAKAVEGNIMLILNDATVQEREKIIFNNISYIIFLVLRGKLNRTKLLIEECISSMEMMIEFKNELITELKDLDPDPKFDIDMCKINQLMDELINKKRSIEEGECSQAKRPSTMEVEESNIVV